MDEGTDGAGLRSIPARAGEPCERCEPGQWPAVYPRPCGGTSTILTPVGPMVGLSPPVRGNRQAMGQGPNKSRSIPARAGEPKLARVHRHLGVCASEAQRA